MVKIIIMILTIMILTSFLSNDFVKLKGDT
jgi:hypothetical protein